MDVLSSVTSIAALVELAIKSSSCAARLIKDLHDAPEELSRVLQQLQTLECELTLLSDIQKQIAKGDDELPLLPAEAALLEQALSSAYGLVSSLQKQIGGRGQGMKERKRDRFAWVLKDKARVGSLFKSLQHTEASLKTVLLLVNVRLSSYSWKLASTGRPTAVNSTQNIHQPEQQPIVQHSQSRKTLTSLFDRHPQTWNNFYGSWQCSEESWLAWLGLHIILTCYGNPLHTTLFLSGKLDLWRLLGLRVICFNLGLQILSPKALGFSILGGSLSLRNVVPETAELMVACQRGDVQTVRALFTSRRASPYDVTSENSGPMRYAIESGSLELVQFLCRNGVDANTSFGIFETSSLEWAFFCRQVEIARFLISRGARLDYLCSRGWTPVMHLFWPSRPSASPEFFQMLCADSFSDFDVQDRFGCTALHRAAGLGTTEDIHTLLQLGASPLIQDRERGWTPAFEAVRLNNTDTLKELAKYMLPDFVHAVDFRGWTILPVAIQGGQLETMLLVLELGADPHRLVRYISEDGRIRSNISPVELARIMGPETHKIFIHALQLSGFDISTLEGGGHDEEDEGMVFWPAESGTNVVLSY